MEKAYCRTCDADAEIHPIAEIYPECGIEKTKSKRKSPISEKPDTFSKFEKNVERFLCGCFSILIPITFIGRREKMCFCELKKILP